MNIVDYIPIGHRNAVTRQELVIMTGLSDRRIRSEIEKANAEGDTAIINLQNGDGYFIPDLTDIVDCSVLSAYLQIERARMRSIKRKLKGPLRMWAKVGA